jgi:hypothetical protein
MGEFDYPSSLCDDYVLARVNREAGGPTTFGHRKTIIGQSELGKKASVRFQGWRRFTTGRHWECTIDGKT